MLKDTIVIFASDNGGLSSSATGVQSKVHNPSGPLRGTKGSIYEGGHRVPMLIRWDGIFPAGESVTFENQHRDGNC